MLWIAFNLITFVDITQPPYTPSALSTCCELLSIWLLLWISHSFVCLATSKNAVVNCFQFDYFCGYHTARLRCLQFCFPLWIAFNLITFVDITQPDKDKATSFPCCELLSIWLLLWISHSHPTPHLLYLLVVNCFQFDYFCGYHTAQMNLLLIPSLLWIAFNLITFVDITQPSIHFLGATARCELLSIWLLLWISHSRK